VSERGDATSPRISERLKGLAVIEGIALAIALVAPLTPSKTGSTWSPAELFTAQPSYLQQLLATFVAVNIIMAFLGAMVWVAGRWGASQ
jgi:predicted TIM-barrel fold metal-dependent hydrolase